jgi:S1-C subfamily serine protease
VIKKLGLTLQDLSSDMASKFGYSKRQGVFVTEVEAGSPAADVGIESGFLIEEANRSRVKNLLELKEYLGKNSSSKQVLLRVATVSGHSKYVAIKYD